MYKKFFPAFFAVCTASFFATSAFAQQNLRDAIDSGNISAAQKMVKKGQVEEIYCGELSPNDAVKVYEKIFKAMPNESLESCPNQFVYGYGAKACSNGKDMATCLNVVNKLLTDATAGNAAAVETLGAVTKAALKTKAYAKPVKEQVDTTLWTPCAKKGKARQSCIEECWAQADTLRGVEHKPVCDVTPEHYVDTVITLSKPSPLYETLRNGIADGFWKAPLSVAESFSKLMQANAKGLSIQDSNIIDVNFVARWADMHKADSSALPGKELFRFCYMWQPQVDSILTLKELKTRCPVFESFVDSRDNRTYKVKDINGTKWFVQNLNYVVENQSKCYDGEEDNCKNYGRLYSYDAAQVACPEGSHLSTDDEWKMLEVYAGGANVAAEKLRSNGSDDYAFSALFGGYINKNNISVILGEGAYFWTEGDVGDGRGVARSMFSTDKEVSSMPVDKAFSMSVRCVVNAAPKASAEENLEVPATETSAEESFEKEANDAE